MHNSLPQNPADRTPVLLTDQERRALGAAAEVAASIAYALEDPSTALTLRSLRLQVLGDLAFEHTA